MCSPHTGRVTEQIDVLFTLVVVGLVLAASVGTNMDT